MTKKLKTLIVASVIGLSGYVPLAIGQDQTNNNQAAYSNMTNPMAWMTMPGNVPSGMPMNPGGNPIYPMMVPGNWVNPNAYMAFMNPQSWGAMMNPMSYMGLMNPGAYSQMMNPAAYMAFMNPNTYAQAMDPNSYMAGMMQMFTLIQNEENVPTDFFEFLKKQLPNSADETASSQ